MILSALALSASLAFAAPDASADDLPGRPMLGLAAAATTPGTPVSVGSVLPRSTASSLGLAEGDLLKSINGTRIADFSQLLDVVGGVPVGGALVVEVERDGRLVELAGSMQPRPREHSEHATVTYGTVRFGDDLLRSIEHRPRDLAPDQAAPAVYFIQGYTCDSIDYGLMPDVTTLRLVDQLVEAGYVVFRMEKPGLGDSHSERHCRQIDFTTESQAFLAGLRALKARPGVDPERVTLFGHSLGVLHAVVMANQEPVASIVGYGGVYQRWYDYVLDIYRVQAVEHFGTPRAEAERNATMVAPFLDQYLRSDTPWAEVMAAETTRAAMAADLVPVEGDQAFDRHYSFFRDLNRYDLQAQWAQLSVPLLMMHGSLDIQAISPQWAHDIVATSGHPRSTSAVIEGAEHAFMRFDDQASYLRAHRSGQYNPVQPGERFDPRVGETTLSWLETL